MSSTTVFVFALTLLTAAVEASKVVRCKSTFRSSQDPACSMLTDNPNNEMMCTSADAKAEIGGYFSVDDSSTPICLTYIFHSNASLSADDFPPGIWLFRSAILDPALKTCENVCSFIRGTLVGSPYKNLYVGCFRNEDENDEDISANWNVPTKYDCSTDDSYYSKPPTTTTMSTTTMSTSASTASSTATTMAPAKTTVGNDQSSSNVVLYIGIAEGVVGLVGALFIIAASIVLYVTLKKVRGEESS